MGALAWNFLLFLTLPADPLFQVGFDSLNLGNSQKDSGLDSLGGVIAGLKRISDGAEHGQFPTK